MKARHSELIAAIRKVGPTTTVPGTAHIVGNMAEFLAELAEDAEKQTAKLLFLTRVLAWLTTALFCLTVFLSYDAYQKSRRDAQTHERATEQHAPDNRVPKT